MGDSDPSEEQPQLDRSSEEQLTNAEDIFAFLEQADARHESADPLERVSPEMKKQITTGFHDYDELSDQTSHEIAALAQQLKGQALHQVRLLAEEHGQLSGALAKAATAFKANDIDGRTFNGIMQDVLQKQRIIQGKLSIY